MVNDDLENLTLSELRSLAESLNINRLDLLGHGSKRETWIKAILGYRADQEYFKRWQQSQKKLCLGYRADQEYFKRWQQSQKKLCNTTTTPENN